MRGIDGAALLTTFLAFAMIGTLIWQISRKEDRRWLLSLILFGLPMSYLTFQFVRLPIDELLVSLLGKDSPVLTVCRLWYAPLTEEPAKLLPLLISRLFFGTVLKKENLVPAALALGLGFAVGEIWLIAGFIGTGHDYVDRPFYQYGGFLNERLCTCICHPGFTVLALWGIQGKKTEAPFGILAAMTFHFVSNFPIFLMQLNVGQIGKENWQTIIVIWLVLCVVASCLILGAMHSGWTRMIKVVVSTKVRCPECGQVYRQPILGGNFGVWRYEPCGACHKWHWISIQNIESAAD